MAGHGDSVPTIAPKDVGEPGNPAAILVYQLAGSGDRQSRHLAGRIANCLFSPGDGTERSAAVSDPDAGRGGWADDTPACTRSRRIRACH